MPTKLRIGTRGSPLALAQAHEVRDRLAAAHPDLAPGPDGAQPIEIVVIKTTGDRILDRPLAEIGGKGLFTKELDQALDEGDIDLCVHSMKDVPTLLPDNMVLAALLPREDPRDVWFARGGETLSSLPAGSMVGTASLRRQAQVLALRPDLRVSVLRGNVATRLAKLERGEVDATMLALAGLNRLGHAVGDGSIVVEPSEIMPAVAQGAIGLQIRRSDEATALRVAALHCPGTGARVAMERGFLAALDGSCRTPIAGLAMIEDGRLAFAGLVAAPDGSRIERIEGTSDPDNAAETGHDLGMALRSRLPAGMLAHATGA
ncbi:hydroxymethylbilane synthase [Fodinicurvata sp. EGI_FJ10296]|uniref:hydroxymethylbilane synthase n=1 Tax=Fodinicurvata sp. EGI_FJ10296 TaxID=3231908 RepID=UPI0034547D00